MNAGSKPLKPKREEFCRQYIIDWNATQAAIRSGYASTGKNAASSAGSQLLSFREVQDRVVWLSSRHWKQLGMSAEESIGRIANIARFSPKQLVNAKGQMLKPHQLDEQTAAALEGVEIDGDKIKYRAASKTRALEMMAKHHGLFEKDNAQAAEAIAKAVVYSNEELATRAAFLIADGIRAKKKKK